MERLNATHHPIHDLLTRRWSPRAFADRAVEPDKLRSILEAARWSASSSNEQPWAFIVAIKEQPDEFQRVLACLVEQNQVWARHAPVLMIAATSLAFHRHGTPNRHAFYDLGQSVAYMTVQAMALGLYIHQMAGFSPDAARTTFDIPSSAEAVAAIALGYPGSPEQLPDPLRQRETTPSTRKTLAEFVFSGKWGQTMG